MFRTITGKLKWQFILFLARRLPDCKTITPTLSESIDRELTLKERIITRLHLFTCEACARYVHQIRVLHDIIHTHQLDLERANPSLDPSAKERMKALLSSAN
jgi:hypothetical protein